jgi:hypothetical protein
VRPLHALNAFVLTALIIGGGVGYVLWSSFWGTGPEAHFVFERDAGFTILTFVMSIFVTAMVGLFAGLPVLLLLRKVSLHRNILALVLAGLITGLALTLLAGLLLAGRPSLSDDPLFTGILSGGGAAAGAVWWVLTGRRTGGHLSKETGPQREANMPDTSELIVPGSGTAGHA